MREFSSHLSLERSRSNVPPGCFTTYWIADVICDVIEIRHSSFFVCSVLHNKKVVMDEPLFFIVYYECTVCTVPRDQHAVRDDGGCQGRLRNGEDGRSVR
jgi:hypothetical protein